MSGRRPSRIRRLRRHLREAEALARELGDADVEALVRIARTSLEVPNSGLSTRARDCIVRIVPETAGLRVELGFRGRRLRPARTSPPTVIKVLGFAEESPEGIPATRLSRVQAHRVREWFRGEAGVIDDPLPCRGGRYVPQWRRAPRGRGGSGDPDPPAETPLTDIAEGLDADSFHATEDGPIRRAVPFHRRRGTREPKDPPSARVSRLKRFSDVSARRRVRARMRASARKEAKRCSKSMKS